MNNLIRDLPKVELHVHIEGTLELEMIINLAKRNSIDIPEDKLELISNFHKYSHDLPSFLEIYYFAVCVLQHELDFYVLTYAYLKKAHSQGIVYSEFFFDPQSHTRRGVSFDTVINGIVKAQDQAFKDFGIKSAIIMCFLRDESLSSALETFQQSLPHIHNLIGVGLDSYDRDNPPIKFLELFNKARNYGLYVTVHCDVNRVYSVSNINEALNVINVDRIDHGYNIIEDENLINVVLQRSIGLTFCPVSNYMSFGSYTSSEIIKLLDLGVKVTVNSDDPAYMNAYLVENIQLLVNEGLSNKQVIQLVVNSFEISWLPQDDKIYYLSLIDDVANSYGLS